MPHRASPKPAAGVRATRQRAAVLAMLDAAEGFATAQQLHRRLLAGGERIGLTTVYRTLAALTERGEVDAIRGEGGESAYRRCAAGHHHHLVCRECGRAVEVRGPQVEAWALAVAAEHGFTAASHTVEVFGRCPQCAPESAAE